MKRALAALGGAALAAALAVPSGAAEAPVGRVGARAAGPTDALVRVAHFSPDTAGVDVWVDGQRVLQNVGYHTVSDYQALPGGEHRLELRPFGAPGSSKAVVSATAVLPPGTAHTVAGVGLNKDLRGQIFTDDLSLPAASTAKVRVIEAAVGVKGVDVVLGGGPTLAANLALADASAYAQVGPGTYDVKVLSSTDRTTLADVPAVDVGSGIVYSFVVIGGGGKPYQLLPVVDARGPAVAPVGAAKTGGGGTATVRVHGQHSTSKHRGRHPRRRHERHHHRHHRAHESR